MHVIRRTLVVLVVTALFLGVFLGVSVNRFSTPSGVEVHGTGDAIDAQLVSSHLLGIDPLELLAPNLAQQLADRTKTKPAQAALDFFTTALQLAIFGYNAIKADQSQYQETPVATANVVQQFPATFSRHLGRSFMSSGTVAKAITVHPLKGPTGYSSADGAAESFKEELEADFDAGGGRDTDWVTLTLDGKPGGKVERENDAAYRRDYTIGYTDVPVGKRRVAHWRSSQQKGGKAVMSVYVEPTSLADLNAVANLKTRWVEVIRHSSGASSERTGKVPFVLQGDGLTSRVTIRVFDTEGYQPNQPEYVVGEVALGGYEPAPPFWVKPGLVRIKLIKDGQDVRKAFANPKPDKPRLDGGLAYDTTSASAQAPTIVLLRSTSYLEGGK